MRIKIKHNSYDSSKELATLTVTASDGSAMLEEDYWKFQSRDWKPLTDTLLTAARDASYYSPDEEVEAMVSSIFTGLIPVDRIDFNTAIGALEDMELTDKDIAILKTLIQDKESC